MCLLEQITIYNKELGNIGKKQKYRINVKAIPVKTKDFVWYLDSS
jgi:hypothetical protein